MRGEPVEVGSGDPGSSRALLALTPPETHLLAPDHPFLVYGEWRAFAVRLGNGLLARVVASVDSRQRSGGAPVGCIGFFASDAARGLAEVAAAARQSVWERAVDWLRGRGAGIVRCPVQLSTWYGHRLMTDGFPGAGGMPPFFLEPHARPWLQDLLEAEGYARAHRAVSCAVRCEAVIADGGPSLGRLHAAGVRDRPIALAGLEGELRVLHGLSVEIFGGNWGFSAISFDEFRSVYAPLASLVDARLVRILETADGRALGFGFALPGDVGSGTFILKTIGVVPWARRRFPGIGVGLTALMHQAASKQGYASGIHALMAERSTAHRLSMRWGTQVRAYATFARTLP